MSDSASPGLDPTTQLLLTIFGAAFLTALAGFAGAWLQGRREHRRWLRQERLGAYLTFLRFVHRQWSAADDLERTQARSLQFHADLTQVREQIAAASDDAARAALITEQERLDTIYTDLLVEVERLQAEMGMQLKEVIDAGAACFLLGPRSVVDNAHRVAEGMMFGSEAMARRIETMEMAMRRALNIKV
jgi:hypothetical protein